MSGNRETWERALKLAEAIYVATSRADITLPNTDAAIGQRRLAWRDRVYELCKEHMGVVGEAKGGES